MLFEDRTRKDILLERHGASGLMFVFLFIWLVSSLVAILQDPINYLPVFFYSPVNVVFGIFFSVVFFYHITFDIKLVLEREISNESVKDILFFMFDLISCISTVSLIIAILQLHFESMLIAQ